MFVITAALSNPRQSVLLESVSAQKYLANISALASDIPDYIRRFLWWRVEGDPTRDTPDWTLVYGPQRPAPNKRSYYLANISLQRGGKLGLSHAGLLYGLEAANIGSHASLEHPQEQASHLGILQRATAQCSILFTGVTSHTFAWLFAVTYDSWSFLSHAWLTLNTDVFDQEIAK